MPISPVVAAALIGTGGQLIGSQLNKRSSAAVPKDLQGLRSGQLQLLQSLLQPGGQGIRNFFGELGSPQTDLQRQSVGGISQFLNQPSPEMRALETTRPILEGMLTGTGPQFERDISLANQQGGRFSSGNAIMRGEAFRNLFNLRNQTAQTLGMLSGQAGQADFSRLLGGFGVGQQQAQQADIGTQRLLQLLQGVLGTAQQTAFNLPITQGQNLPSAIGQGGFGIAQLLALLQGQGGGGGGVGQFALPNQGGSGGWAPPPFGSSFNPSAFGQ